MYSKNKVLKNLAAGLYVFCDTTLNNNKILINLVFRKQSAIQQHLNGIVYLQNNFNLYILIYQVFFNTLRYAVCNKIPFNIHVRTLLLHNPSLIINSYQLMK